MTPLTDDEFHAIITAVGEHGLSLLRLAINAGPTGELAARDALAHMLDAWPILCKSAEAVFAGDKSYAAVIFYERTRLGKTHPRWFLDGLPSPLPVFGAPVALEFPAERMRDLLYDDVLSERLHTIEKLEQMAPGSNRRASLAKTLDHLPDLDANLVPQTVRLYISRVRSMCKGLRNVKAPKLFQQCQNTHCNRLFYLGERENKPSPVEIPIGVAAASKPYWAACCSPPHYKIHRFCCGACEFQWLRDYERMLPDYDVLYDSEKKRALDASDASTSELGRVSSSFDVAIARNWKAARVIRKKTRQSSRASSLSRTDLSRELSARIDMLNVDTGLLYASKLFAQLTNRAFSKALPGKRYGWRLGGHERHRNALIAVTRIYRQLPEKRPVTNLLTPPPFFRKLRAQVTEIF